MYRSELRHHPKGWDGVLERSMIRMESGMSVKIVEHLAAKAVSGMYPGEAHVWLASLGIEIREPIS